MFTENKIRMVMANRLIFSAVAAALCSLPLQVVAQHAMGDAIIDFANKRTGTDLFISTELSSSDSGAEPSTHPSRVYEFGIPKKKFDAAFAPIIEAYGGDRGSAYATFEKYEGYKVRDKVSVFYGNGPKEKITFGGRTDSNCLVMAVRDSLNPGKRYVYGVEWYDDPAKRKHIRGKMAVVYGDDPKLLAAKRKAMLVPSAGQLAGLEKLAAINPDSLQNLDAETRSDIGEIAELSRLMLERASAEAEAQDTIATEDDFLDRFEQLRHSYIEAVKSGATRMVTARLARKIRDLCSKHSDVLSPSIRENVVAVGMYGVTEVAVDPYEIRLLIDVRESLTGDKR